MFKISKILKQSAMYCERIETTSDLSMLRHNMCGLKLANSMCNEDV